MVLAYYKPKKLIIFSRDELKQYEIMCSSADSHLTLTVNRLGGNCVPVEQGFEYNSGDNIAWLDGDSILEIINKNL
jgi:hypothetical protein